ncbi:MAG: HlyD family efflux transporter periplasmic adaptor subunit [Acidobacteriota bacterium]
MSFYRTDEFLEADGFRHWLWRALVLTGLLGLWLAWFFFARVSLFEQADSARLEASRFVHRVEVPVSGRIEAVAVVLGASVRAGDVLVELESEEAGFELLEAEKRLSAKRSELALLRDELSVENERLAAQRHNASEAAREATSRAEVEAVEARYARTELEQVAPLQEAGLISLRDILHLEAEAERTQTEAEAERLGLDSLVAEQQTEEKAIEARLARLRREAAAIAGQIEDSEAHLEHLRHEIEERSVRAPVDGVVGWLSDQQAGSFVAAGERLAEVVPAGEVRVVAYFPVAALGRLRSGQPAQMRLEAYPWAQFGTLRARVEQVATEPEAGRVRAELTVVAEPSSAITLEHGLTGQVEVEVEAISPALLVLRAAGSTLRPRDVG